MKKIRQKSTIELENQLRALDSSVGNLLNDTEDMELIEEIEEELERRRKEN